MTLVPRHGPQPSAGAPGRPLALAIAAAACALLLAAPPAAADDRDLLGSQQLDPYVFVLFDVSGSMNWQPAGDFWSPAHADDPNSKFYQAKSALFEVLTEPELDDVHWGFATYNQDRVLVARKHWVYAAKDNPSWVGGALDYPLAGEPKIFGDDCMYQPSRSQCRIDDDDDDVHGVSSGGFLQECGNPFDLPDPLDRGKLKSAPVLGERGGEQTEQWVRDASFTKHKVTWKLVSGALGDDEITVELTRETRGFFCNGLDDEESEDIVFERLYTQDNEGQPIAGATETIFWQFDSFVDIDGNPNGFWDASSSRTRNTGDGYGWDPNDDTSLDNGSDVALKWPTQADPAGRGSSFDRGDLIPLDWQDEEIWGQSNRDAILAHLAPNFDPADLCPPDDDACVPASVPEFRVAPYFEDQPDDIRSGRLALKPEFAGTPPLVANGSTPIGNSMRDFMDWFDNWKPTAADVDTGDPLFGCRPVNLLILTDGDETVFGGDPDTGTTDAEGDANPCWIAERLLTESQRDIKSYVVAFGVQEGTSNFLDCIADRGGTGIDDGGPGPILPQNQEELVDALLKVLTLIGSDTATFASAAVPSIQVGVEDKIFLTSFRPVPERTDEPDPDTGNTVPASIWDGHLDAFLRPLPLDADGKPDDSKACAPGDTSNCHLWDAGDELVLQAPSLSDVESGVFRLGTGEDERRVYYGQAKLAGIPYARRLFLPPAPGSFDETDLWSGMGIPLDDPDAAERSTDAIEHLLRKKDATIDTDEGPLGITYVLGDIFHSNPVFVSAPRRVDYFLADLYGPEPGEEISCDVDPFVNRGYRCFFERHRLRRKMLMVGSNDAQVHAFDAGIFSGDPFTGEFDNGSGRELFGFIPRSVLPTVLQFAEEPEHDWGVDGTLAVDDVFIDPVHDGVPSPGEREWRTVGLAGLREGGSAYVALDVTHPDVLDADFVPQPEGATYVPSCHGEGGSLPAGCGTQPFPTQLWEFTDTRDEDSDSLADLGDAWSIPNVGRIQICTGSTCDPTQDPNDLEDRFVAVFGGGLDPGFWEKQNPDEGFPREPVAGSWLYLVDVETGVTLYKRKLSRRPDLAFDPDDPMTWDSSAPSEPAAVDTDFDGYLDTIYIGTTDGLLFKADISEPAELETTVLGDGTTVERVLDPAWDPFPLFESIDAQGRGRPIFLPPAVVFVPQLAQYALAFGTGHREDLWEETGQEGRFHLILDENYGLDDYADGSGILPLDESLFQAVVVEENDTGLDYLLDPQDGLLPGWYIPLDVDERLITRPFGLSGIVAFAAFLPDTLAQGDADQDVTCARRGTSRIFVVLTTNANSVIDEDGIETRFWSVDDFVTDLFTVSGTTQNVDSGGEPPPDDPCADTGDVRQELMKLYPTNCNFSNVSINLQTLRTDLGVVCVAPIPVCLQQTAWTDEPDWSIPETPEP